MSKKYFDPFYLFQLPSGQLVHPCRLIHRDGTLMWKHALIDEEVVHLPADQDIETRIIYTAKRLEELNTWVAPTAQPWEGFSIHAWYNPNVEERSRGNVVLFSHFLHDTEVVYNELKKHLQEKEALSTSLAGPYLKFTA
jgi:hypothetical protein